MADLRLYARFEYQNGAALYKEGDEANPIRVTVVDIGLGGVQLSSKQVLPVAKKLTLQVGKVNEPIRFGGIVRYSNKCNDGTFLSGFKFLPDTHDERVQIAEFVHEVFHRQWELLAS